MPLDITATTSLSEMIDLGLIKFVTKLEEISVSASREFSLEKNLEKMKLEWVDICFELSTFRYVLLHRLFLILFNCFSKCDLNLC